MWAICSRLLFCKERQKQFAHSHSYKRATRAICSRFLFFKERRKWIAHSHSFLIWAILIDRANSQPCLIPNLEQNHIRHFLQIFITYKYCAVHVAWLPWWALNKFSIWELDGSMRWSWGCEYEGWQNRYLQQTLLQGYF